MTACMAARFLLACTVTLSIFRPALAHGGEVSLAWDLSFDPRSSARAVGYTLHFGLASGVYTSSVAEGANRSALVTGLTPGLEYYFAVTAYDAKGVVTMCSGEVTNRLPAPPSILAQPLTQTGVVGAAVTLAVTAGGDPPLSFQWLNGGAHSGGHCFGP